MLQTLTQTHSVTRIKPIAVLTLLAVGNVLLCLLAWRLSAQYPFLLATGWLAYGFGLRHAVDADHICAIDNTTRKLMQEGKRPVAVGLYFSLGHSTVVLLLCAALALSTAYVQKHLPQWHQLGGLVGTLTSAFFLYVIGFLNLAVLWNLGRSLRHPQVTDVPAPRGLLGRLWGPLFGLIHHSRQMYFVGFLFGLGFDTASEVGILALSARSGQAGVPFWVIMLLPLLFMAGMCLVDTLNGVLMLGAYGWASVEPARKTLYNVAITLVSVLVAFAVATHELLPLLGPWFAPRDSLGCVIPAAFLLGGVMIFLFKRSKRPCYNNL